MRCRSRNPPSDDFTSGSSSCAGGPSSPSGQRARMQSRMNWRRRLSTTRRRNCRDRDWTSVSLPHKRRASMSAVAICGSPLAREMHSGIVRTAWPSLRPASQKVRTALLTSDRNSTAAAPLPERKRRSISEYGASSPRPVPPTATIAQFPAMTARVSAGRCARTSSNRAMMT